MKNFNCWMFGMFIKIRISYLWNATIVRMILIFLADNFIPNQDVPLCYITSPYSLLLTVTSLFELVGTFEVWSSVFSADSSTVCSSWRHFILLFWNQTLTWLSERPNMEANWCRSPLVRYFWTWKRFSRPLRWRFENTALVQGLRGLRCFTWEYRGFCGST